MCVGSTYVGQRVFAPYRITDSKFHEWILDSNCTSRALDLDLLPSGRNGRANHHDEYRGISVSELRSRLNSCILTVSWWGKICIQVSASRSDFFFGLGFWGVGGLICCNLTGDCWTLAWTFAWVHAYPNLVQLVEMVFGRVHWFWGTWQKLNIYSESFRVGPAVRWGSDFWLGCWGGRVLCPIKFTGAKNSSRRSDLS
jgi:hypothetical protein